MNVIILGEKEIDKEYKKIESFFKLKFQKSYLSNYSKFKIKKAYVIPTKV